MPSFPSHDSRLLTAADVCAHLRISRPTLRKLELDDLITPLRIGRLVRYRKKDVNALVESLTVQEENPCE